MDSTLRHRTARAPRPIPNLGPKSTVWLQEIGVRSMADLHAIGAVEAYRRVKTVRPGVSIVLLYALQGAVFDCRWNDLPPGMKEELQAAARHLEAGTDGAPPTGSLDS